MMPSDEDLNSLLNTWTVPPSPDALADRLRSAWRERHGSRPRRWFGGFAPTAGLFAGVAAGAAVFLLVIAQAFPQSLAGLTGVTFPFTVDAEQLEYKADGSSVIREYLTQVPGLILSSEFPDDPFRTAQQRILDPLNLILWRITQPARDRRTADVLASHPLLAQRMAELRKTCGVPGTPWTAVGNQKILNYATIGIQKIWTEEGKPVRLTQWSAPDLQCFALKLTTENTMPDGTFRPAWEYRALKVTVNPTR